MDKNEYNLKLGEIDKCVDQKNYEEAAHIADQIEWKRVRNVRTLCKISEVYEAAERYEDSKALLLRAYRRSPVGRTILYRLVEITIKLGQFDEAIEYYSEYVQAAPHDNNRLLLKYKIYRGRGSSVQEQIQILKEYLDQEYNEKYVYELAKLYLEADHIQECLSTCDDLVLWFQSGTYVRKALELKQKYTTLTPKQQDIYERELERKEEEELGQEKQIVPPIEDSEAQAIIEDTSKDIAKAVQESMDQQNEAAKAEASEGGAEAATVVIDQDQLKKIRSQMALAEQMAKEQEAEEEQSEAKETAGEEDTAAEDVVKEAPQVSYDTQTLQTDVINDMRQIVSGVGLRDEVDPDEAAIDEVIEASKQEQAAEHIHMSSQLKMPQKATKAEAGKLSIDDVLLSMGAKGEAVRQAVERVGQPSEAPQANGVLSAVDEALLGMGIEPEKVERTAKKQNLSDSMEEIHFPGTKRLDEVKDEPAEATEEEERVVTKELPTEAIKQAAAEAEVEEPSSDEPQAAPEETAEKAEEDTQEPIESAAQADAEEVEEGEAIEDAQEAETTSTEEAAEAEPEADQVEEIAETEVEDEVHPAENPQETDEEDIPEEELLDDDEEELDEPEEEPQSDEMSMDEMIHARTRRIPREQIREAEQERERAESSVVRRIQKVALPYAVRDMFSGFTKVEGLETQIATALNQALAKGDDRTSRTGNILITGGHGTGKTTIATNLAMAIAKQQGKEFVKMAKIYATNFNRKDIAATIAKIAGGILIIEEAGDMEDAIADQLTTAMEFRTDGLIIIMEDEQKYLNELLMRHPRLTMKFNAKIHVPHYTLEELVVMAQEMAGEADCVLSEDAQDTLYARLEERQRDEEVSLIEVKELTDRAVKKADKLTRKMFGGKKRYDEEGRVILLGKDFV